MYPRFLELHMDDKKISVNVDHLVTFADKEVVLSVFKENSAVYVDESYSDIAQLIHDTGCQIQKADPRLDTTTPLTLEDLRSMISEPVWNANTRKWLLVEHVDEGHAKCKAVNDAYLYYNYTAEDLVAKPLYRMRREA